MPALKATPVCLALVPQCRHVHRLPFIELILALDDALVASDAHSNG